MEILSQENKLGCPTCEGIDPKSCAQCHGKTKLWQWFNTQMGWSHISQLKGDEIREAERILYEP